MANKSVSVRGLTYFRVKAYAKDHGSTPSKVVQGWLRKHLSKQFPKEPFLLYEVGDVKVLARTEAEASKLGGGQASLIGTPATRQPWSRFGVVEDDAPEVQEARAAG